VILYLTKAWGSDIALVSCVKKLYLNYFFGKFCILYLSDLEIIIWKKDFRVPERKNYSCSLLAGLARFSGSQHVSCWRWERPNLFHFPFPTLSCRILPPTKVLKNKLSKFKLQNFKTKTLRNGKIRQDIISFII